MRGRKRALGLASAAALALICATPQQLAAHAPRLSRAERIVEVLASRLATISGYRADLAINVRMRDFPFIQETLHGTTSYRRPAAFTVSLPRSDLARSYQRLNDMDDPSAWSTRYATAIDHTAAPVRGHVALRLVPKARSDVDHMVATIDRLSNTVQSIDVFFRNGGRVSVAQNFKSVDGLLLVTHQDIDVATPDANISAKADLDHYSIEMRRAALRSAADLKAARY